MKKALIYILVFMFLNISFSSSPKWYIEVVDNTYCVGDRSSIKLDSKGYPHISYNEYNYDGELRYAYFDGNKWNIEIVDYDTGPGGTSTSLALDKDNHPHISYYDDNIPNCLKYAYYDGSKWNIEIVDNLDTSSYGISIALDSSDHPHISYYNVNAGNEDLKYAYFDGTKWNIEVIDSQGRVGWWSSIAIDKNDHPHISYGDETNRDLKYAYFDGTKWNIEVVDNEGSVGRCTSIALDKEDNPHIAYLSSSPRLIKYAYKYDSKWIIEEVDNQNTNGSISLALDSKDLPHISYNYYNDYGPERLMYAYYDGKEWNKEVVDEGEIFAGGGTSIAIDKYNFPHISYNDADNLRYARYGYGLGITLTSFSAKPHGSTVVLNWNISTDEDISGFNLYRREVLAPVREIAQSPLQHGEDYVWTKVNTSLITGTSPYSYKDKDIEPETRYEYKLEAVVSDKSETLGTIQATSGNGTPSSFEISRIYPTPAESQINIDVIIPEQTDIDIAIYDIAGRKVSTIAGGQYNSGEYTLTGDISCLTNGVYIVRMTAEGFSVSKNFVIAK
jgi:hypothetical protein